MEFIKVNKEFDIFIEGMILEDNAGRRIRLEIEDDLPGTIHRGKNVVEADDIRRHNMQVYLMHFFWDNDFLDADLIDNIDDLEKSKEYIEEYLWKLNEKRTIDEIYDYLFLGMDGEYDELDAGDLEFFEVYPDVFEWAKSAKGVTDNINNAGYVLPDGEMLDFSGQRHGGGGGRQEDHRQLNLPVKGNISGTELMNAFINMGAIRIDANSAMIDIATKPTPQQLKIIRNVLKNGGYVDMINNGKKKSFQVDDNRMALGKIQRFFGE